jgi:hypothetical protein
MRSKWQYTPNLCNHRVAADACTLCNPAMVVVTLTCSGCRAVRTVSVVASAGTVAATNVAFLCRSCASRRSVVPDDVAVAIAA